MAKAKQLNENAAENPQGMINPSRDAQSAKLPLVKKKRRKNRPVATINVTSSDSNIPVQPILQLEHLKIRLASFRPYILDNKGDSSEKTSQPQDVVYKIIAKLINECEKKLQDCEQTNEVAAKNALLEIVNYTFVNIEKFIKIYQATHEALHTLSSSPLYKILGLVDLIEHNQQTFNGYMNKVFEDIGDLPQAIEELTSISQQLEPFELQMDAWAQPYNEIQQYLQKITMGFANKDAMIEIHQKALYAFMSSTNSLKQRIASLNEFKVIMELLHCCTSSMRDKLTEVELELKKLEDMCGVLSKVVMDKPTDIKQKNQLLELLEKGKHNLQVFIRKYVAYVSDYHTLDAEQQIINSKEIVESFSKLHISLKKINTNAMSLYDAYIAEPLGFQEDVVVLSAPKAVSPQEIARQKRYIERKLDKIREYQVILSQIEHIDNHADKTASWDPNGILNDPAAHKKWSREKLPELTQLDPQLAKEYSEANIDQLSLSKQIKALRAFAKRFEEKANHFEEGLKKFINEQEVLTAPVLSVDNPDRASEQQTVEPEQPSGWRDFTESVQLAANGFQQAVESVVTDASKHTLAAVATVSALFEKPIQSEKTVIVEPIIEEQPAIEPVQVNGEDYENPVQAPIFDTASLTGLSAAEVEAAETKAILEKEQRRATEKAVFKRINRTTMNSQDEFAAYVSMSEAPVVAVPAVVIEEESDADADEEADEDFYRSTFPTKPQSQPKPAPSFKTNLKTVMSLSLLGMIKEAKELFEKHAHREPTVGEQAVLKTASMALYICTAGLFAAGKAAASAVKTSLFGLFDKKPAKVVPDVDNGPYIPGMKDLYK